MADVDIRWNDQHSSNNQFEALRRLPAVKVVLFAHALDIAAEADDAHDAKGYVAVVEEGKTRSRAAVVTSTPHAVASNAKHHTLLKIVAKRAIK